MQTEQSRIAARAWRHLLDAFGDRKAGWTRVHAAEALSALDKGEAVRARLIADLPERQNSAQRIGAWRVLATRAKDEDERRRWISDIERVARDTGAADRLQAIETLGKLGHVASAETLSSVREMAFRMAEADALLSAWVLHLGGETAGADRLGAAFTSPIADVRRRAAFISRRIDPLPARWRAALKQLAETESTDSVAYPYIIAAALTLDGDSDRGDFWRGELERMWGTATSSVRLEIAQALMPRLPEKAVPPWVAATLNAPDHGSRVASAWTTLYPLTGTEESKPCPAPVRSEGGKRRSHVD